MTHRKGQQVSESWVFGFFILGLALFGMTVALLIALHAILKMAIVSVELLTAIMNILTSHRPTRTGNE